MEFPTYGSVYTNLQWIPYHDAPVLEIDLSAYESKLSQEQYENLKQDLQLDLKNMLKQLVAKQEQHLQQIQRTNDQMMMEFKSQFEMLSKHVSSVADHNANCLILHLMQELELLKQELAKVVKVENGGLDSYKPVSAQHLGEKSTQNVSFQPLKDSGSGKPNNISSVMVDHGDHLISGPNVALQLQIVSDFEKPNIATAMTNQKSQLVSAQGVTHYQESMPGIEKQENVANAMVNHKIHLMSVPQKVKSQEQSSSAVINNNNPIKQITHFPYQNIDKNVCISQEQEQCQPSQAYFQRKTGHKQDIGLLEKEKEVTGKNRATEASQGVQVRSYSNVVKTSMKTPKDKPKEKEFNNISCSTALDVSTPRTMAVLGKGTFEATGSIAETIANQMKQMNQSKQAL